MLLLARLAGLGFLANFLSRTVLVGFLTGVGIQVAAGQLPDMLGGPRPWNADPVQVSERRARAPGHTSGARGNVDRVILGCSRRAGVTAGSRGR